MSREGFLTWNLSAVQLRIRPPIYIRKVPYGPASCGICTYRQVLGATKKKEWNPACCSPSSQPLLLRSHLPKGRPAQAQRFSWSFLAALWPSQGGCWVPPHPPLTALLLASISLLCWAAQPHAEAEYLNFFKKINHILNVEMMPSERKCRSLTMTRHWGI